MTSSYSPSQSSPPKSTRPFAGVPDVTQDGQLATRFFNVSSYEMLDEEVSSWWGWNGLR